MLNHDVEALFSRSRAPGCVRDARQRTDVAAELPFFNDAVMARQFIDAGVDPLLDRIPGACRVVDLGGADGFLLQAIRDHLVAKNRTVTGLVVDANAASLAVAQRRGLRVVPADLQHVKLSPVDLVVMRLVLHYNGLPAQRRILLRAFEVLKPGAHLVLQAEAGDRNSVVFRNLLVQLLERRSQATSPGGCRWQSTRGLLRSLRRCGYEIIRSREDHFVFETRLTHLARLAWSRFHGTPNDADVARTAYEEFARHTDALAKRMMQRNASGFLRVDADGSANFISKHALVIARKPDIAGADSSAIGGQA